MLADWTKADGQILTDLDNKGLRDQVAIPHKKTKGKDLPDNQRKHNRIHNALRAVGERVNALLKSFKVLHKVNLTPWKIDLVVKTTLVILHTEHQRTA